MRKLHDQFKHDLARRIRVASLPRTDASMRHFLPGVHSNARPSIAGVVLEAAAPPTHARPIGSALRKPPISAKRSPHAARDQRTLQHNSTSIDGRIEAQTAPPAHTFDASFNLPKMLRRSAENPDSGAGSRKRFLTPFCSEKGSFLLTRLCSAIQLAVSCSALILPSSARIAAVAASRLPAGSCDRARPLTRIAPYQVRTAVTSPTETAPVKARFTV